MCFFGQKLLPFVGRNLCKLLNFVHLHKQFTFWQPKHRDMQWMLKCFFGPPVCCEKKKQFCFVASNPFLWWKQAVSSNLSEVCEIWAPTHSTHPVNVLKTVTDWSENWEFCAANLPTSNIRQQLASSLLVKFVKFCSVVSSPLVWYKRVTLSCSPCHSPLTSCSCCSVRRTQSVDQQQQQQAFDSPTEYLICYIQPTNNSCNFLGHQKLDGVIFERTTIWTKNSGTIWAVDHFPDQLLEYSIFHINWCPPEFLPRLWRCLPWHPFAVTHRWQILNGRNIVQDEIGEQNDKIEKLWKLMVPLIQNQ